MGKGTLTIYSASAGSGKTYKLTGLYLKHLFLSRFNYRRILAVTFTNKATAEMKSRILDNLNKLAVGDKSEYLQELIESTEKSEEWIRKEAADILNSILHDFSRFSVSTIDSFFQKILRAFAREIGLYSGFSIELDHSVILSKAVDEMIASSASDIQLNRWLISYAMSNIDDEKSWNLKAGIIKLAEELFKEKFKILSSNERSNLENKEFLLGYIRKIKSLSVSFAKELQSFGIEAEKIYSKFALTDDMFYRKGQGVPRYIKILASGSVKEPNSYVREIMNDPPRWSTGALSADLQAALNDGLGKILPDAIQYYDENIVQYRSSEAILSNIYALGILSDVLKNVHLITNSENTFLLSDAGELLNLITSEDQASFIYEKVGNRYENFMVDEFQDTSIIQWNNFWPLIENSMAEGFDNLVVGDVKQSIYRWRNSDWQILGSVLNSKVDSQRFLSKPLATNWRSRSNIISFNNTLFSIIPSQIDVTLSGDSLPVSFKKLYSEAKQSDPGKKEGGYVRLEFLEDSKDLRWQEAVLERLPLVIENFQEKGYNASDIGIIVRDGKEGARVLKTIIDYSNNLPENKRNACNFNVVSNDSLLLSNSPAVSFIIAAITVINNPADMISRALMLRLYLLATGSTEADRIPLVSDRLIEVSGLYFPDGSESFLESVKHMSLFEATESIIRFFNLGDYSWNNAYLSTFQDFVVSYASNKNSDIQSFLEWWETTGSRKSVVLPGNQDAMRILTIHKSKGLEFKVVILPFLSWNLDHIASKQPVLWVKPDLSPFDDLGIVPVRYNKVLSETIFSGAFKEEKYSVYLDNINLLYVAFTRAKDAIYGFSVANPRSDSTIAGVLMNALSANVETHGIGEININRFYNAGDKIFEFGDIPENTEERAVSASISSEKYIVSRELESLKLKLHGENYFSSDSIEVQRKINYGKLMHEVFEGIQSEEDISNAVNKLVYEGKLAHEEASDIELKVRSLIKAPPVSEWFSKGNEVMTEAGILLTSGNIRRPDRVILRNGKTIIIDFKFGEENPRYIEQVNLYSGLLADMGYKNIESFIWYVDKNLIVSA